MVVCVFLFPTHQLVQIPHVAQNPLLLPDEGLGLRLPLFILRTLAALLPAEAPARRALLSRHLRIDPLALLVPDLLLDLLLQLDQHGGQHAELGAASRHLEQAEHEILLVASLHQVVGLEHEDVLDPELLPAPADEIGDVVSGQERAGDDVARLKDNIFGRHLHGARSLRVLQLEVLRGAVHVVGVATEGTACLQRVHEGVRSDI